MTVNFYLNIATKTPEQTIYVYIRGFKGKTFVYNTGEKIIPKYWDREKQKAKKTFIDSPQLNEKLTLYKTDLFRIFRNLEIESRRNESYLLTPDVLKKSFDRYFLKETESVKELFEVLDLFITTRKSDMIPASLQKFRALKNHLIGFEQTKNFKVKFENINLMFYDLFRDYLISEKSLTNNTVYKIIGFFKTFMNWATKRKANTNLDYKQFQCKETKTETIYLTDRELFRLLNFDLSKNPRLSAVRDSFCFACFTGVRFSDLFKLQWNDIKGNVWYLRTTKTKDILEIPLNGYAVKILSRHTGEPRPLKTISNQKMNTYLKELCKSAEINDEMKRVRYIGSERIEQVYPKYQLIGTHTARRTFITLSLEKGMRPETVMEITGHKNYKTMKKYINISSKVKATEMHKVWTSPNLRLIEK